MSRVQNNVNRASADKNGLQLENRTIIIGVLCIDLAESLELYYGQRYGSYIAASYVKYLESCGSMVVPIWIGKDRVYYEEIMEKVNGICFPGGSVFIVDNPSNSIHSNECVKSSKIIYELAKEKNKSGIYFPLWGTCLGFELLVVHDVGQSEILSPIGIHRTQSNINFAQDYESSRMFKDVSASVDALMRTESFAQYYHRYCLTVREFNHNPQLIKWNIIAKDVHDAKEYVTIAEHADYPFYGVQFHPERVAHESLGMFDNLDHSTNCILAAQYFGHFFVNECRKNHNTFLERNELMAHLIHNFKPVFTGRHLGSRYLQCYLFKSNPQYLFHDSEQ